MFPFRISSLSSRDAFVLLVRVAITVGLVYSEVR